VLLPGTTGKPILSQLRPAPFGGGPSISIGNYEALSYTWGSPDVTYRILVNGISFHIRQNLYWALLKLRLSHTERVLWIDAICINQNYVNERNHQVQQMADIYRRASRVIVWLGPSTPSSRKAALLIRHLRSISLGNFALYEAQWPGVRDLCSRPYWKRIWIVQEFGVARNIQIVCGEDQLSWNDFSQLLLKISTSKAISVPEAVQSIKSSLASRPQTQRAAYQSHGCILWRLLRDFADSLCAVPHDKVYGLLGLASGGMSELIVDYSKSLTELQRDLVALYNEDLRDEASNTAEDNPKMPNIFSFASFLSRSLRIHTEDMTTFDFNPVLLPPAQTHLQVEATLVGVITALHSKESYAPLSSDLPFKGS
jgi:hypothetical protein